ncbi:MAG: fimbrillin family protein [Saccharofermentans sp.]|nr:fimbrillin family protein [Saccharofermentans sp.]
MLNKVQNFVFGDKRRTATIVGVVMFLCALLVIGVVYAKYVRSVEGNGSAVMKEFYFTSDLLDGNQHTLAAGSTVVSFTLSNHADALRYSEVDINYTVEINDANDLIYYSEGVLVSGSTNDDTITISDLTPGNTYTITATGNGGYHQELTATIVIPEAESHLYYYLDTSNTEFVILTVWAQGYSGAVTITPPNSVIPDNTDVVMRGVNVGAAFTDSVSFADNGYSSHAYRFFGSGVSVEQFIVSSGTSVEAEVRSPG